jgi:hypothetical protein
MKLVPNQETATSADAANSNSGPPPAGDPPDHEPMADRPRGGEGQRDQPGDEQDLLAVDAQ